MGAQTDGAKGIWAPAVTTAGYREYDWGPDLD